MLNEIVLLGETIYCTILYIVIKDMERKIRMLEVSKADSIEYHAEIADVWKDIDLLLEVVEEINNKIK